jgi:hypothetical protein
MPSEIIFKAGRDGCGVFVSRKRSKRQIRDAEIALEMAMAREQADAWSRLPRRRRTRR